MPLQFYMHFKRVSNSITKLKNQEQSKETNLSWSYFKVECL